MTKQIGSSNFDNLSSKEVGIQNKNLSKKNILLFLIKKVNSILCFLDSFINYVTRKNYLDSNNVLEVARAPILFGIYVIVFFVVTGGIWASFAPLDSAAVAIGVVVSSTNKKIIQHPEGGIISSIFVSQGDIVKQGDKLIELEDTKVKSQYESILNQYRHAIAMESRLIAERDDMKTINFPDLLISNKELPEVISIIRVQENLFNSKHQVFESETNALRERSKQLKKKIEGLEAKKIASIKNLEVITNRVKGIDSLYKKGFIQKTTLLDFEAKEAILKSEIAMVETEIVSTNHVIVENDIAIINLRNKYLEKTLTELRETQSQTAHLREQIVTLQDLLDRVIIRSPVDGIVNSISENVHTIGGVIAPGVQIMEITPLNDQLIIEAKVPNKYIDSVHEGLKANIRFSAFKSRTTPSFNGRVITISPDIVRDKNSLQQGENFYIAKIEIDMQEFSKFAKAKKLDLHPGMQAEVQIVTGTRTLLRYMLDPITDTMFRSFKEK